MRVIFEIALKVLASIPAIVRWFMDVMLALIMWDRYYIDEVDNMDMLWNTKAYKCAIAEEKQLENLIMEALFTDGGHHKQWYLEKIAHKLRVDIEDLGHEKGIAP